MGDNAKVLLAVSAAAAAVAAEVVSVLIRAGKGFLLLLPSKSRLVEFLQILLLLLLLLWPTRIVEGGFKDGLLINEDDMVLGSFSAQLLAS